MLRNCFSLSLLLLIITTTTTNNIFAQKSVNLELDYRIGDQEKVVTRIKVSMTKSDQEITVDTNKKSKPKSGLPFKIYQLFKPIIGEKHTVVINKSGITRSIVFGNNLNKSEINTLNTSNDIVWFNNLIWDSKIIGNTQFQMMKLPHTEFPILKLTSRPTKVGSDWRLDHSVYYGYGLRITNYPLYKLETLNENIAYVTYDSFLTRTEESDEHSQSSEGNTRGMYKFDVSKGKFKTASSTTTISLNTQQEGKYIPVDVVQTVSINFK